MRINALSIQNFKAIENLAMSGLTRFVVVAGPNGCGKSCILDAIRLLKSVYGGYQPNEWQQWFGEFQIDINTREGIKRLFRDPSKSVVIEASIELDPVELTYLSDNLEEALEPIVWRDLAGVGAWNRKFGVSTRFAGYGQQVGTEILRRSTDVRDALANNPSLLKVTIDPNGSIQAEENKFMELIFQMYDPQQVGIIDYHSALRNYQREDLGSVDLNARNFEAQKASASLYNWQSKYQGIKSRLVADYIQEIVARENGVERSEDTLNSTMQELFRTFFPEKEYLGVRMEPDGSIQFPVRTAVGIHDINELSAGEKEIVYGYLRLRNSAPRNSIILIDEPELHLNPGLLRGMPGFYHKHLGEARNNQLWLVTHSDALLRSAIGNINYSVFHMSPPSEGIENQVSEVMADDELERATIALVGDLASYQPHKKVILLEGGGDTDFDVVAVQRLFPDVARRVNLVSTGSKRHVSDLYEILTATAAKAGIVQRFFAIVDRDSGPSMSNLPDTKQFTWDRYHIENYLLSDLHILEAANELSGQPIFNNEPEVTSALIDCAREIAPKVVIDRLTKEVNDQILQQIDLGGNPTAANAAESLKPSLEGAFDRLSLKRRELLEEGSLADTASTIETEVLGSLAGDGWRSDFPGREILKRLVGRYLPRRSVTYEAFRMLIIGKMVTADGMRAVLHSILKVDVEDDQ